MRNSHTDLPLVIFLLLVNMPVIDYIGLLTKYVPPELTNNNTKMGV